MKALTELRYLKTMAIAKGDPIAALSYAGARSTWDDKWEVIERIKAGSAGLSTGAVGLAAIRAGSLQAAIRPLTIFGRLQGMRAVPPRVRFLTQLQGARARWAGEGKARRLTAGTYTGMELKVLTVAAVTVSSDELLADESELSEMELLRDLVNACAEALDLAFLDPLNAGVANVVPASITNAATPISFTGATIEDLNQALAEAIDRLVAAGSNLASAAWVMRPELGARMGLAREQGGLAWPDLGALGGELAGLPVWTSASNASDPNSDGVSDIVLVDGSQISYAEEAPAVRTSKEAAIEMIDTPTGDSTTPVGATSLVSMFQSDSTALMASMRVNWKVRRPGFVQVISGVRLEIGS